MVAKSDVPNNEMCYNKEIVPFCSRIQARSKKTKLEQSYEETNTNRTVKEVRLKK
jgi:hypothetical protein